jgi:hypothetical protein
MSNHFHILVRTGRQPLSASLHRLRTGYMVNFNKRQRRAGHLFQNRCKSTIVCEDDPCSRDGYERFVTDGIAQGSRPEIVGGGLVRSYGNWSQVVSLRKTGEAVNSDARILGGRDLVEIIEPDSGS